MTGRLGCFLLDSSYSVTYDLFIINCQLCKNVNDLNFLIKNTVESEKSINLLAIMQGFWGLSVIA